jgi:uncharacterized protein
MSLVDLPMTIAQRFERIFERLSVVLPALLLVVLSSILWSANYARAAEVEPTASDCSQVTDPSTIAVADAASSVGALHSRVTDLTGVLSTSCKNYLAKHLEVIEKRTGVQLALLIVASTGSETIEEYAVDVFAKSKLGQAGVDNGLLLVAALKDRKVRLEVGYGLEGVVTDSIAARIIAEEVKPAFKQNRFGAGLHNAVDAIAPLIGANAENEDSVASSPSTTEADVEVAQPDTALSLDDRSSPNAREKRDDVQDFLISARTFGVACLIIAFNAYLGSLVGLRWFNWRNASLSTVLGYLVALAALARIPHAWLGNDSLADALGLAFWFGAGPWFIGVLMGRYAPVRRFVSNICGLACLCVAVYLGYSSLFIKFPLAHDIAVVSCTCAFVVAAFHLMDLEFFSGVLFFGAAVEVSSAPRRPSRSRSGFSDSSLSSSSDSSSSSSNSSDSFSGGGGESGGGGASDSW